MKKALFLVLLNLLCLFSTAQKGNFQGIEPPNWWNGFHNRNLQLIVYGKNIALTNPSVFTQGVELIRARTTDSPDHLFLDLRISTDDIENGAFPIVFSIDGTKVAEYLFDVKENTGPLKPVLNGADSVFVKHSAVNYYRISEKYQTNDVFFMHADTLHQMGTKIILEMDMKPGPGHKWVSHMPSSDWLSKEKTSRTSSYYLNLKKELVVTYLKQNALWWVRQFHPDEICINNLEEKDKAFLNVMREYIQSEFPEVKVVKGCNP